MQSFLNKTTLNSIKSLLVIMNAKYLYNSMTFQSEHTCIINTKIKKQYYQ